MERQDGRTLSMQALAERWRRAVKLREKGMPVNEVARACELSRGTVIAAHKAYCLGGWAGVALKPRGRSTGVGRRLNAEQEREVQKLIRDKTPDQIKMPYAELVSIWSDNALVKVSVTEFDMGVESVIKLWNSGQSKLNPSLTPSSLKALNFGQYITKYR